MQSFLAKYSEFEEQVIVDGPYLIIIRKLPTAIRTNREYKEAKLKAARKGGKIEHAFGKEQVVRQTKHKPMKKLLEEREIKIMGRKIKVRLDEENS